MRPLELEAPTLAGLRSALAWIARIFLFVVLVTFAVAAAIPDPSVPEPDPPACELDGCACQALTP